MTTMSRLELSIAWRYLRSRRGSQLLSLISVIAIGGVIIGVGALILIIGVMNGLQRDLREKILIGSPDIRVLNSGEELKMPDWRSVMSKVERHPDVVSVAPFVLLQAGVTAGGSYGDGARVLGIEPYDPKRRDREVTTIRRHATGGDFTFKATDGSRRGIVVGERLAGRLGVVPGIPGRDSLTLVSISGTKFNATTGTIVPKLDRYEVTGIFSTGMFEYDESYIVMDLDEAQKLAGLDTAVTGLEVRTTDRWVAKRTSEELAASLQWPYRTEDWEKQNSSLFQALKLEKLGMSVILGLIILVAAFNIVGTLTMVVSDKTREIGILRAMGMTASSIRRIFFTQGLVIGVVGTGIGLIIGLLAAVALERYRLIGLDPSVYFIDHLPVETRFVDVALIVLASLAIAALATLYPSRQAARLYPVEAIRHE
jgi:lipoprotein-releasing system permease protein